MSVVISIQRSATGCDSFGEEETVHQRLQRVSEAFLSTAETAGAYSRSGEASRNSSSSSSHEGEEAGTHGGEYSPGDSTWGRNQGLQDVASRIQIRSRLRPHICFESFTISIRTGSPLSCYHIRYLANSGLGVFHLIIRRYFSHFSCCFSPRFEKTHLAGSSACTLP